MRKPAEISFPLHLPVLLALDVSQSLKGELCQEGPRCDFRGPLSSSWVASFIRKY